MTQGNEITSQSQLLSARQVGALLSVSTRTVWRMLSSGQLPQPIRIGTRLTRWRLVDIQAFLADADKGAE